MFIKLETIVSEIYNKGTVIVIHDSDFIKESSIYFLIISKIHVTEFIFETYSNDKNIEKNLALASLALSNIWLTSTKHVITYFPIKYRENIIKYLTLA